MKELEIIKKANINGETTEGKIYIELRNIIEEMTDMYRNPDKISTEKVDMTDAIRRYGYNVDDYKEMFGSTMRSEMDVVKHLADILSNAPKDDNKNDADRARKKKLLLLAQAKIKIAQAQAMARKNN